MKKTTLIAFYIVWSLMAAAQKYVRIDTVYTPYFDFDYEAWMSDTTHPLLATHGHPTLVFSKNIDAGSYTLHADRLEYNYIEGGANIYGISVWGWTVSTGPLSYQFLPNEYLFLYDATPDSLIELAQVLFDNLDTNAYIGWGESLPAQAGFPFKYCNDTNHRMDVNFYRWEFYFDKPIHVDDSFYVGHSNNSGFFFRDWPIEEPIPQGCEMLWGVWTTDGSCEGHIRYDSTCWMPARNCKLRIKRDRYNGDSIASSYYGLQLEKWGNYASHEFFLTAPILRTFDTVWTVDTPACTPVYDLTIMSRYGNTVSLRWRHDGTHDEWQVSYGPQGTPPDDGTWVESHSNIWRFTDTLGIPMVAYVRTVCRELDTLRYSEWSDPVEWQVFPDGFDPMDRETDGLVSIRPNPATEGVTVSSACVMNGIEVFNASGMKYLEPIAGRHSASFSVQGWPKGLYLIVVHTPQGDISKKLVVGD